MDSIQTIKADMQVNTDMSGMVNALKEIAIAEFRVLERKKARFEKFSSAFAGFFHMIDFRQVDHPFSHGKGPLGIIIITSNEGFMGGLNNRVIESALGYPEADQARLIMIGQRGAAYLQSMGLVFTELSDIKSEDPYEAALKLRDFIVEEGLAGRLGRLLLFYPRPLSFTVQRAEQLKILPCSELFERKSAPVLEKGDMIVESRVADIIKYLVETWIAQKLFEVFEDSKLAEFSARTVRLEESYQNLLGVGKGLRQKYFRTHHEIVDKEMRDMFAAQIIRRKAKKRK